MPTDRPGRGRPAKFVRRSNGKEIHGLSLHKATGRYYATFSEPRVYFGSDLRRAFRAFHYWKARAGLETVTITSDTFPGPDDLKLQEFIDAKIAAGERAVITIQDDGTLSDEVDVAADAFWTKVRDALLDDPHLAAERTGIKEIAYLERLKPPPPSKHLSKLVQLYLADKPDLSPKERQNSNVWWSEFCETTGAEIVSDLGRKAFRKYRDEVKQAQAKRGLSNAWTRSRFGKIKAIINHAVGGEMELSPEDRSILELRALLKPPPKPPPSPVDISRDELHSILRHADSWEKALILVGLNCAYYPIDCSRLQWSMIDFRRGAVRFDRTKAIGRARGSVPRVAVLWKRTMRALKKIENDHSHVFISAYGTPVHIETIRNHWKALCEKAGVTSSLTFANLRDSAMTVAASSENPAVPEQQYHALAGHVARGVDDNYIRRKPRFVETACRVIERYYFGR